MEPTSRAIRQEELLAQMGWVRELARGLVADQGLADDLAQEAWLAASTRPPSRLEGPAALRAWLAAVVRNLARQDWRSSVRRARREAAAARPEALESAADVVSRGALHSELAAAVMQLPEPYRSAVLLRYLDGLSAPEVARRQQVSHVAARKRISRGLALLRERLDAGHGGDREAWVLALSALVERGAPAPLGAASTTIALPGALALIVKTTVVVAAVAVALLAAWMLGPGSSAVPEATSPLEIADAPVPQAGAVEAEADAGEGRELASAGPFALEVTDERGVPRPGFLALLLEGDALVARTRTDAEGRLSVPDQIAPDRVVLTRVGFAPCLVDLEPGSRAQRVVLADGGQVSGHVELPDGSEGIELILDCDREHAGAVALDAEGLAAMEPEGVGRSDLRLRIEHSGAFSFGGLPAGWTGALELEPGWTIAAAPPGCDVASGRELLLLGPIEGLTLAVRPPVIVTGRIVAVGDDAPVVDALVTAQPSSVGLRGRLPNQARSDAEGRFAVAVAHPSGDLDRWSLRMLVTPADRGTVEVARLGWEDLQETSDLGDLVVDPGRELTVLVRDSGGDPLGGAELVLAGGGAFPTSRLTDEVGRAILAATQGENVLFVSAAGYRPRKVDVPSAGQVEVVLERANLLEVRVSDPSGAPIEGLFVRVEAERSPFAVPAEELAGGLPFDAMFVPDDSGRLVLSDLEPGLPLTLSVLDGLGSAAARREVRAPAPLSHVEVELLMDAQPFYVAGRTVDSGGRALPRAEVYVEGNGQALRGRTDADGAFAIGPLLAAGSQLHLEATRPGFLPVVLDGLVLDPRAEPLELVLERGRSLDVFLTDTDGRAVQVPYVVAAFEGRAGGLSYELEPGHHRFDLLPQAPGELQVLLGGVAFTSAVGANEPSTRFVLPPTGRLEVSVDTSELPIGERTCVVLQALDQEGEPDRTYFLSGPDGLLPRSFDLATGRYRVQLESRRLGGPGGSRVTPLGQPLEISVTAGQTLSLTLP